MLWWTLGYTCLFPFWFPAVLEKTLESPLDSKVIQPVHPKGNQSWIYLEGLMLKLKLQYFGYLMRRADSLEKSLMLGKIEGGRRRGRQRIRWHPLIRRWHHWLNRHELGQTPGVCSEPMSIELMMPSSHLILYRPLLLPPSIFPNIRVFSNEAVPHMRWPKYWSFSFSISPSMSWLL